MGSGGFVGGGIVTVCMVIYKCVQGNNYTLAIWTNRVVGSQSVLRHTKSSGFAVCLWVLYD